MRIIIFAFIFRLVLYVSLTLIFPNEYIATSRIKSDPEEFNYTATHNLEVPKYLKMDFPLNHWYEHNPVYVLFLWILTPGIALYVQIFIASIGVWLMWKMNHTAGIIWNFYSCWYDIIFLKESLMFSFLIMIIYKFTKKEAI